MQLNQIKKVVTSFTFCSEIFIILPDKHQVYSMFLRSVRLDLQCLVPVRFEFRSSFQHCPSMKSPETLIFDILKSVRQKTQREISLVHIEFKASLTRGVFEKFFFGGGWKNNLKEISKKIFSCPKRITLFKKEVSHIFPRIHRSHTPLCKHGFNVVRNT